MHRLNLTILFTSLFVLGCNCNTVRTPVEPTVTTLPSEPERTVEVEVKESALNVPAGCPEGTFRRDAWAGEYPGPVVQLDRVIEVQARTDPCDENPSVTCSLEPGLYHPWAEGADLADFATVATVRRYRLLAPLSMTDSSRAGKTMDAGQEVFELSYLSEGYCLMEVNGEVLTDICVSSRDPSSYEVLPSKFPVPWSHQFFRVPCGGTPAWVLIDEEWESNEGVSEGEILGFGSVGPS